MSEDGEIDVESDDVADFVEGADGSDVRGNSLDKRAHHNALERKRRDHIKDSFHNLRDCIPAMSGEKVSRAHILNKATEYIRQMQKASAQRSEDIESLKKKNELLEEQVVALEQAKKLGSSENQEDLLASVAAKVQQRQTIRQQQSKANPKVQLEPVQDSHKADIKSMAAANKDGTTITAPLNLHLATNIKTTQSLLNALAKIPGNSNATPAMRSLARAVLASPLRPQGTAVNSSTPRGIVTATTVPWTANATTQPAIRPQEIQAALSTTAAVAAAAAAAAATTSSSSSLSSTTASLLSSILPNIDTSPLDVLAGTASAATSFLDLNNPAEAAAIVEEVLEVTSETIPDPEEPPSKKSKAD